MHNGLSLAKMTCSYFDLTPDTKEFKFVFLNSIKYLLHQISASEFNKRIKTISKKSAKDFRLMLCNSGYCTFLLKLHVIEAIAHTRTPNFKIKASRKKFKIKKSDRLVIDCAYKDKEIRARVKQIVDSFGNKHNLPTMEELTATLVKVLKRMEKKINAMVYKKLNFIVRSNNMDNDDMKKDLIAKIIQGYYWLLPTNKSETHWVMTMMRVVKNTTVNLIEHWTYQKRARMYQDTDGSFKLRESSSNVTVQTENDDLELQVEDHEISTSFEREITSSITTQQLYAKFATTERCSKVLKVMMGIFDEDFTKWLKSEKCISRTQDNSDFQDQVENYDFLCTIARFVKMTTHKFFKLIERMRLALNSYNREAKYNDYCSAAA